MRRLLPFDRRRDRSELAWVAGLTAALALIRLASLAVVYEPGYTDAYYFVSAAGRLARGEGLSIDAVWNYLEAPLLAPLPVPSHRFWMPLASLWQALGIAILGALGDFRGAQLATVVLAVAIPPLTYVAARRLGAGLVAALAAGAAAGLGGAFAPGWVSADAFAIAAVLGTLFFLALARAAATAHPLDGALTGLLVGLLYLARAEAAIFGLALVWLAGRRSTARAGRAGLAVAIAIGLAWLARGAALGLPGDLLARALLPLSYADFFAVRPPTFAAFIGAPLEVVLDRAGALSANAATAAVALVLVPAVPLVLGARARWARPEVRAFALLFAAVYLAQSLLFPVHSVRGSFFHALAAFFPFALALAAAGADDLLAAASRGARRLVFGAGVAAFGAVAVFALGTWDVEFNGAYRARAAAAAQLPAGPVVVADAAAWRWISGHEAVLAPSEGPAEAACIADVYLARSLVLEPAHFAAYDELYRSEGSGAFTLIASSGGIRIYAVREDVRCITAQAR